MYINQTTLHIIDFTTFLYFLISFHPMIHEVFLVMLRKIVNPLCLGFQNRLPQIRHHSFNRGGWVGRIWSVQVWKPRPCLALR